MRCSVSNCAWLKTCLHRFVGVFLLGFIVLLAGLPAFSQGTAGRILGAVTDQTGGAMSGATVTIIDTQRNTTRTLTADDSGEYNAPNLLPSTYTVRAEAKGFKTAERANIILEVNQDLRVDLTLQPGEQTERITVTEALPMVETTNAELGGTLQSQIIADLPMNGRNFANLLQLRPGVTIYPGGSGWTQSTNGQRAHDNVYLFDGVNGSDPWMAQPIISAVMGAGDAGTLISIDAIDEFKTEENPRAEYGWKPGAIVNVGIKSGTNAMHGTAFAYGRDGSWDALPYFNTAGLNGGVAQPAPPLALEQFGATLGGPIKKDKLFYFLSFEDQRYNVGSTGQISDPITAPGVGSPANNMIGACNAVLAAGATPSPLSLQLAGLSSTCTPLANYPGLFPTVGSSTATIPNDLNNNNRIDSGIAKIDYHITDKHSLNGMYEISPGLGLLNDAPGGQTNNVWLTNQYARSQVFAANWTWVPTSTWVNEFRVGYSHYFQDFEVADKAQNPADYSFNGSTYNMYTGQTNPLYFGFPVIVVGAFTGQLGGGGWPKVVGPNGVLQLMDHVSYLKGKHAFKFGGEVLYNRSNSDVTSNGRGSITFGSLEDFFTGVPDSSIDSQGGGSAAILAGNLVRRFTYTGYAAFAQDDWRVTPRLTVNLGLRYELTTVPKEAGGLQGNFIPGQGLIQTNSPYAGDHNNFSPRLGFAWDIFGNGKTVLRGGGGILYEQLSLDVFQGIGNSFGLRVEPTGDMYCTGGVGGVGGSCTQGSGNIAVANVSLATGPALDGSPCSKAVPCPASFTTAAPGSLAANWGANSPMGSIFPFVTACGDGNTPITGTAITPAPCNAIEVDPKLRTPYVETWNLDIQRALGNNLSLDIGYVGNHGVKLIGALDINQDPLVTLNVPGVGPVTTGGGWTAAGLAACAATPSKKLCAPSANAEQLARPFDQAFPYLKYIDYYGNLDTSNYNGLQAVLTSRNYHGLTLTGGYTYSHALGESSDQGTSGGLQIPANSYGCFRCQLYTSTAFDMRHRFTISGTYAIPGRKGFGQMLQGWSINTAAVIQTGTPWGINDNTTDFAGVGEANGRNPSANEGMQWDFFGNPSDFEAIHNFQGVTPGPTGVTGIPYYAGTSNANCLAQSQAMGPLAVASLKNLGCYALDNSVLVPPAYGSFGTMPRNPWRDQGFRNWDISISKAIKINERLSAQFRAEFFNVLNTVNFVNPFGGPGGAGTPNDINPSKAFNATGLGYVLNTPDAASSNPILGSGGNRDMQLGLKLIF